ncbi:MAG TPA: hypothetical protein VGI12_01470 [Vicinamibacterales bacterium]|jgi:hypothetical protein
MGVVLLVFLALLQAPVSCPDAARCRADAEAADARGDYETFHDLAWRAVQAGKPNDPALMLLLARAQSLSGRPEDAIVMLGRLADLHVPIDLSLADFDRARQRPGWAALAERMSAPAAPAAGGAPPASPAPSRKDRPAVADATSVAPSPASASRSEPARAASAAPVRAPGAEVTPPPAATATGASTAPPDSGMVTEFEAPAGLGAFALAHDAVSRRFVIGDARSRRLLIVDEVSKHVVPYVSAASAGFYDELTALTVDARRGDLWVASVKGSGDDTTSIVHKLQLVSGRGLMETTPAVSMQPVRFVALAVTPDGTLFGLDSAGGRVFRLRPGSRAIELACRVEAPNPTALAAADDRTLFVASDRGLQRVDLPSRVVQTVKSVEDLSGFVWLAWRAGALYGVQHASGASLAVRLVLDAAGARAQPRAILAASPDAMVATVADGGFYYLLLGAIHRLPLR